MDREKLGKILRRDYGMQSNESDYDKLIESIADGIIDLHEETIMDNAKSMAFEPKPHRFTFSPVSNSEVVVNLISVYESALESVAAATDNKTDRKYFKEHADALLDVIRSLTIPPQVVCSATLFEHLGDKQIMPADVNLKGMDKRRFPDREPKVSDDVLKKEYAGKPAGTTGDH